MHKPLTAALALLLFALLAGCGTAGPPPTTTVSPLAAPTTTTTPPPTIAPTATAAPTIAPTAASTATAVPVAHPARALYPCGDGLCSIELRTAAQPVVAVAITGTVQLAGYALSPGGGLIVYGLDNTGDGQAELFIANPEGGTLRRLFTVSGAPSGLGELEGFGAIGLSADDEQVIFEDQAQVFVAALDGSARQPVTEQIGYGVSSFHRYTLSPRSDYLLYRTSNRLNLAVVYRVADGAAQMYELELDRSPVQLIDEGERLLVARIDPPFDPTYSSGNPAAVDRTTLGYEVLDLAAGVYKPLEFATSTPPAPISNISNGRVLVEDGQGGYSLYDLESGIFTPVTLPGRNPFTSVSLYTPRQL